MAKIMVVDDDTQLSTVVADALQAGGHLVDTADNGAYALELLDTYAYDLIVLDWNLPDMNGPEIASRYRHKRGQAPIIMLTARTTLQDKSQGFDAGADDYLTKPFQLVELLLRVKALLRRPQSLISDKIEFGNIVLDVSARRVTVEGAEVSLSPREYAILELLLRHPQEVFSQDAIVDRLWPSESAAIASNVYTVMKSLRKKLKQDIICTVYGAGYRLRTP